MEGTDLNKWSTLTATVDVLAGETYIKLQSDGFDASNNPLSVSYDYHDTSPERWTSGTGLGLYGLGGDPSADNAGVSCTAVVTAVLSDGFYFGSTDRTFGIRVVGVSSGVAVGQKVSVSGTAADTSVW